MKHKLLLVGAIFLAYLAGLATVPAILVLASLPGSGTAERLSWSATTGWQLTCPEPPTPPTRLPSAANVDGVVTSNEQGSER
jgi:hypothetical protein